jgi:hypothetical protein
MNEFVGGSEEAELRIGENLLDLRVNTASFDRVTLV